MLLDKFNKQETILFELSEYQTAYVTVKKDNLIFLIHEKQNEKERYIVNGKPEKWFKKVLDFRYNHHVGYYYNIETEKGKSFVVNGKESRIQRAEIWGLNKKGTPFYTQSVNADEEYPHLTYSGLEKLKYPFYNLLYLSQDLINFSYQSATYPEYDDFRFIRNNKIFFNGDISDIYFLKDISSSSWMGSHNDGEGDYPYLKGKKQNDYCEYYEPLTFTVCPKHQRYMYSAAEDFEGNNQRLVLDGEKCSGMYKEILWTENIFSSDSRHFAFTGKTYDGERHVFADGDHIGTFEYVSDSCFVGKENKFAFLKYNDIKYSPDTCSPNYKSVSLVIDKKTVCEWPVILSDNLIFSKAGNNCAFIVNYYSMTDEFSKYALVLNGKVLWEFDKLCPDYYRFSKNYPIFFNCSDTILYCSGIKNKKLILYRHCI